MTGKKVVVYLIDAEGHTREWAYPAALKWLIDEDGSLWLHGTDGALASHAAGGWTRVGWVR